MRSLPPPRGHFAAAAPQSDPQSIPLYEPTALANLAVLDASADRLPEALRLLDHLLHADPTQTAAGLNCAFIDCRLGPPGKPSR